MQTPAVRLLARQACRRHEPPRHEALALGIQLRARAGSAGCRTVLSSTSSGASSAKSGCNGAGGAVGSVEVVADVGRRQDAVARESDNSGPRVDGHAPPQQRRGQARVGRLGHDDARAPAASFVDASWSVAPSAQFLAVPTRADSAARTLVASWAASRSASVRTTPHCLAIPWPPPARRSRRRSRAPSRARARAVASTSPAISSHAPRALEISPASANDTATASNERGATAPRASASVRISQAASGRALSAARAARRRTRARRRRGAARRARDEARHPRARLVRQSGCRSAPGARAPRPRSHRRSGPPVAAPRRGCSRRRRPRRRAAPGGGGDGLAGLEARREEGIVRDLLRVRRGGPQRHVRGLLSIGRVDQRQDKIALGARAAFKRSDATPRPSRALRGTRS